MGTTFDRACREHRENAGHKGCARNPISNGCVELYDAARQGIDVDGPFAVVCSEHGSVMGADSKRDAITLASDVGEWCPDCAVLDAGMPRAVRPMFDGLADALVAHLADDVARTVGDRLAVRVKAQRAGHYFEPGAPTTLDAWLDLFAEVGPNLLRDVTHDPGAILAETFERHGCTDALDRRAVAEHVDRAMLAAAGRLRRNRTSPCTCDTTMPPNALDAHVFVVRQGDDDANRHFFPTPDARACVTCGKSAAACARHGEPMSGFHHAAHAAAVARYATGLAGPLACLALDAGITGTDTDAPARVAALLHARGRVHTRDVLDRIVNATLDTLGRMLASTTIQLAPHRDGFGQPTGHVAVRIVHGMHPDGGGATEHVDVDAALAYVGRHVAAVYGSHGNAAPWLVPLGGLVLPENARVRIAPSGDLLVCHGCGALHAKTPGTTIFSSPVGFRHDRPGVSWLVPCWPCPECRVAGYGKPRDESPVARAFDHGMTAAAQARAHAACEAVVPYHHANSCHFAKCLHPTCDTCGRDARVVISRDSDGHVTAAACTPCVDPTGSLLGPDAACEHVSIDTPGGHGAFCERCGTTLA